MVAPFTLVIFGATGDLTQRKLIPSLFKLFREGFLPQTFSIIGFSRRNLNQDEFVDILFDGLPKKYRDLEEWRQFTKHISYCTGDFGDFAAYSRLSEQLAAFDKKHERATNSVLYLATPPDYYETIIDNLYKAGLGGARSKQTWTRILIEKPFGTDLAGAQNLDNKLSNLFGEDQIYRIDHYLGKETVQNIIAFRFANGIYDPVWNRDYIDHVQITLFESSGIGTRGNLYDGLGALRDVTQNHLMQLIAMTAMEQPKSFDSQGVREARCDAISKIRLINPDDVGKYTVRGQYTSGIVSGREVSGYRREHNVLPGSDTETYVAMKLFVDSPRFRNVPFYVRAGKRLNRDVVEISLVFKQVCHVLFREVGCPEEGNILTLRIQPEEGISTRFIAKEPGHKMKLTSIDMDFSYAEVFSRFENVDAYERVLQDAFLGDQMLFNRSDELLYSWGLISRVWEGWERYKVPRHLYKAGTWGPKAADRLIEKDGRKWIIR